MRSRILASRLRSVGYVLLPVFAGILAAATNADDVDPRRAFDVLQKNCFSCHGAAKTSGLDLRTGKTALAGGAHGPVIIPFKPDESKLIRLVSRAEQPAMPPGNKLSDDDVAVLRAWIEAGAPSEGWGVAENQEDRPITPAERNYWAFRPPKRTDPPRVTKSSNPIDAFLLAAMQSRGLKPSPRADS